MKKLLVILNNNGRNCFQLRFLFVLFIVIVLVQVNTAFGQNTSTTPNTINPQTTVITIVNGQAVESINVNKDSINHNLPLSTDVTMPQSVNKTETKKVESIILSPSLNNLSDIEKYESTSPLNNKKNN
jgi:hypothetical protein